VSSDVSIRYFPVFLLVVPAILITVLALLFGTKREKRIVFAGLAISGVDVLLKLIHLLRA
jgi:hypothetical protein